MVGWESFSMWNLIVYNAVGARDYYYVYQGIMAELLSIVGISQEGLHTETFPAWAVVLKTQLKTGKE